MNFLGYVKRFNATFAESPFNRVDALVLCWLAYFNFPAMQAGGRGIPLGGLSPDKLLPPREMYSAAYCIRKSKKLFSALTESRRFRGIELCAFRQENDEADFKQFAALCLRLGEGGYFVAFRGTDPSFFGWREAVDLCWRFPIPSQTAAARFLVECMAAYGGEFIVGGHSKGGNLAVYAAGNCAGFGGRISKVFNFDGPGFRGGIYAGQCPPEGAERAEKIVPNSSFVGMLLYDGCGYGIVKSRNLSLLQHDPFSWVVRGNDFVRAEGRSHFSVRLERALNGTLDAMTSEERQKLVGLVFGALYKLKTRDFNVFFRTIPVQAAKLYVCYRRLDGEDRRFFNGVLRDFRRRLIGGKERK